MAMVEMQGLNKHYGDVVALVAVDLSIEEGEFVTLLGPSGSGKTTMLNLIAGMIGPTDGRIFINGEDATSIPPNKRGLGMVFQNYALMPHMTVFENVAFPLRVRRVPSAEIRKRVGEVLELVQLPDVAVRKPRELSGGQQQRIALARCIVYNPSIILMDEPLGALDKKLREQMQLELKSLHTELGITMLYVTHDQEEALTMSDRIVLLNEGEIVQMGSPDDMYFHPRSVFAADFLGDSNLMDATIDDVADGPRVTAASGHTFRAQASPIAEAGRKVKIMVRPENVEVVRDGDGAPFANRADGKAVDSIILGGVIKHYVDIGNDQTVVAQELTRAGRTTLHPGSDVSLGWHVEDLLVLPLEGRIPN